MIRSIKVFLNNKFINKNYLNKKNMKQLVKDIFLIFGFDIHKKELPLKFSNHQIIEKSKGNNYIRRFREIISDPLNLMIERCSSAGFI